MKTIDGLFLSVIAITAALIGAPFDGSTQESNRSGNLDSAFITKNIIDNVAGISLAQLAEHKATDPEIKKAATQIVEDHNQLLIALRRIGRRKNIVDANDNLNTPASANNTGMQSMENLTGRDFEKLWVNQMLSRHESKIEEIEGGIRQLADVELRSLINRYLQKIKVHRDVLSRLKYKYQQ